MPIPTLVRPKLKEIAKKGGSPESSILRKIISGYLKEVEKKALPSEPRKKTFSANLIVGPRTIGKDQDLKLREPSEKTGRSISELIREAAERWFAK